MSVFRVDDNIFARYFIDVLRPKVTEDQATVFEGEQRIKEKKSQFVQLFLANFFYWFAEWGFLTNAYKGNESIVPFFNF